MIEIVDWDLHVSYYKKDILYKKDIVNIDKLDGDRVEYLPNERILSVKCKGDDDGCIQRKTYSYKALKDKLEVNYTGYYARMYFMIDADPETIKKATAALNNLVVTGQGYKILSAQQHGEEEVWSDKEMVDPRTQFGDSVETGNVKFRVTTKSQATKRPLGEVDVMVLRNGIEDSIYKVPSSGKLNLELAFDQQYIFKLNHPDYLPMYLNFDTKLPPRRKVWFYTYKFSIPFVELEAKGINKRAFEDPFAQIRFFGRQAKFKDDPRYKLQFEKNLYGKRDMAKYRKLEKKLAKLDKKEDRKKQKHREDKQDF